MPLARVQSVQGPRMLGAETIRCAADAMHHLFLRDPADGGHEKVVHQCAARCEILERPQLRVLALARAAKRAATLLPEPGLLGRARCRKTWAEGV